jgi:WD40 repeat protein
MLLPGGKVLLAIRNSVLSAIGLTDGAVLWTIPLPQTPVACDRAVSGAVACLGANGGVFVLPEAKADAKATQIVKENDSAAGGLVRWIEDDRSILVAGGTHIAVFHAEGEVVQRVKAQSYLAAAAYDPQTERVLVQPSFGAAAWYRVPSLEPLPPVTLPASPSEGVWSLSVSPGSRWAVVVTDRWEAREIDLETRSSVRLPADEVRGASFSSDGRDLILLCVGGAILHVDPASGEVRQRETSGTSSLTELLDDPEGNVRVGLSIDLGLVVWGKDKRVPTLVIPGGQYELYGGFRGDGKLSVLMLTSSALRRYDLPSATSSSEKPDNPESRINWSEHVVSSVGRSGIRTYNADTLEGVASVQKASEDATVSPDGRLFATLNPGVGGGGTIEVHSMATGAVVPVAQVEGGAMGFAWSPDSRALIELSHPTEHGLTPTAGALTVVPLGSAHAPKPTPVQDLACCNITVDRTGSQVLSMTFQGESTLWNGRQGKLTRRVDTPNLPSVQSFTPDGTAIVFGLQDGSVAWWDMSSTSALKQFPVVESQIVAISFRPDGRSFVAMGSDGSIAWVTAGPNMTVQAIARWNEASHAWVTVTSNREYSVSGMLPSEIPMIPGYKAVTDLLPALLAP